MSLRRRSPHAPRSTWQTRAATHRDGPACFTRPKGTRRASTHAVRAGLLVLGVLLTALPTSSPAGAQSAPVNVSVRVWPTAPEPGDNVTAEVTMTGCPRGAAVVELYITTSDGYTSDAALMARAASRHTVLWRERATLTLPNALAGWYGVRVRCGDFSPPQKPMANTLFAVGADTSVRAELAGSSVAQGGTLKFSGTGCGGPAVEWDITQNGRHYPPFKAEGLIPVNPDGSWSTDLVFPTTLKPGTADLRSRCSFTNSFGSSVYLYYPAVEAIDVTRAAPVAEQPTGPA